VIASGGAKSPHIFVEIFPGRRGGRGFGSFDLHDEVQSIRTLKEFSRARGVEVRLPCDSSSILQGGQAVQWFTGGSAHLPSPTSSGFEEIQAVPPGCTSLTGCPAMGKGRRPSATGQVRASPVNQLEPPARLARSMQGITRQAAPRRREPREIPSAFEWIGTSS